MAVISLSIYLKVCLYKHIYIFQKSIGKLGHINLSTNIIVPTYFYENAKTYLQLKSAPEFGVAKWNAEPSHAVPFGILAASTEERVTDPAHPPFRS
jgi:hypothetical protein